MPELIKGAKALCEVIEIGPVRLEYGSLHV